MAKLPNYSKCTDTRTKTCVFYVLLKRDSEHPLNICVVCIRHLEFLHEEKTQPIENKRSGEVANHKQTGFLCEKGWSQETWQCLLQLNMNFNV